MKIDAELEDLNEALLQMSSQVLENLKKALDYYLIRVYVRLMMMRLINLSVKLNRNVLKFYFMNVHMQEILRK